MPELPEVETIARRLHTVIVGKQIQAVAIHRSKSFQGSPELLIGATVQDITRKSKILQFHFDRPTKLLIHLKMTGQLIYQQGTERIGGGHPTEDWVRTLPSQHTRVSLTLSDGAMLFFNDLRVFGWLKVATESEVAAELASLGPDIIDPLVTPVYVHALWQRRTTPIKLVLMDNAIAAGVGNIYANDALNVARIDPFRPAQTLSFPEVEQLLSAVQQVIQQGIELGGATVHTYRSVDGLAGKYQTVMRVYGKEGAPCPNCAGTIVRKKQGGRSTFYCPRCQK